MSVVALAALWLVTGAPLGAQQQQQQPQAKKLPPAKVSILIERYQADKKVSSMPFSISLTGGFNSTRSNGSVRIGVDVPIGSNTTTRGTTSGNSTQSAVTSAPQYQNVGTQIDCYLNSTDQDGVYILQVRLSDSSIYDPAADREAALAARGLAPVRSAKVQDASAFRTFSFDNSMEMHDSQTAEFVNATDKMTGEIVKVLVTLNMQK